MSSLLSEVRAVRSLLDAMQGKPGLEAVKDAQMSRLADLVSKSSVTTAECPAILEEIDKCGLAKGNELMVAVSQRVGAGTQVTRAKLQDFTSLAVYFKSSQWEAMSKAAAGDPLDTIFQHASRLGLKYPSEHTWQRLTAIYLCVTSGIDGAGCMAPVAKVEFLKHVKRSGRRVLAPGVVEVGVLPQSPADYKAAFPEKYSAVFGNEPPAANPFGSQLFLLADSIRLRGTASAATSIVPAAQFAGQPSAPPDWCAALVSMLAGTLQQQMGGTPMLSNFKVFQGAQNQLPAPSPTAPLPLVLQPPAALDGGRSSRRSVAEATAEVRRALGHKATREAPQVAEKSEEQREEEETEKEEEEEEEEEEKQEPAAQKAKGAAAKKGVRADPKGKTGGGRGEKGEQLPVFKRPAGVAERATKRAKVCVEDTRSQVRCRRADGTSFAIPWGSRGGRPVGTREGALREAHSWLAKQA